MLRVLAVVLLMSCGGDNAPKADPSGDTTGVAADAGKVREVTGAVTATRGTTSRKLAVGNPVGADEVIDTGTDGSVVIELAHNNALWSLESGIKARVDQSVAWGLPKQEVAKAVEHATSSAGRHADRQAADTGVTAAESAVKPNAAADSEAAAAPAPAKGPTATPSTIAPPPPPPPPTQSPRPSARPKDSATAPTVRGGGGGGGCDEVTCTLEPDRACCSKFKKGAPRAPSPAAPNAAGLPNAPGRQDIVEGVNKIKARLVACGDKATTKGMLKLLFKVGSDGSVTSAEIKQSPDAAIDQCVIGVAKTLKLPRSQLGITFTYPFTIN